MNEDLKKVRFPILAIDYGRKHVGLAFCDRNGSLSSPLKTVHLPAKNYFEHLKKTLKEIIDEYRIETLLVGLPQNFEESHQKSQDKVLLFIEELREWTDLPLVTWDESFSTKRAENMLLSTGQSRKKSRGKIDSIACAIFLQEFLNYYKQQNEKNT